MTVSQLNHFRHIANLIVAQIPDHGFFCGTFKDRQNAERMATVHGLEVRPFGVDLKMVDPQSGLATDWRQIDGWSTWSPSGARYGVRSGESTVPSH